MLVGRAAKLQKLGLSEQIAPGQWTFRPGMEQTLRDLSVRGDIIKTMHRAMSQSDGRARRLEFCAAWRRTRRADRGPIVERGLHEELEARPMP